MPVSARMTSAFHRPGHHASNRQTSSGSALPAWPAARDYAPAAVVYPYGENSASAGNKYGGAFCGSTNIPAVAEPDKASKNRIAGIVQLPPAMRK